MNIVGWLVRGRPTIVITYSYDLFTFNCNDVCCKTVLINFKIFGKLFIVVVSLLRFIKQLQFFNKAT